MEGTWAFFVNIIQRTFIFMKLRYSSEFSNFFVFVIPRAGEKKCVSKHLLKSKDFVSR